MKIISRKWGFQRWRERAKEKLVFALLLLFFKTLFLFLVLKWSKADDFVLGKDVHKEKDGFTQERVQIL